MSAGVMQAPDRRSGWRSVRRAAATMLWQAAPWVLVVLVVLSLFGNALAARGAWSGAPPDDFFLIESDQGIASIASVPVGLVTLSIWMRTVRIAVPVLVAGGVTRRAATGGLLIAAVALALVATAMLTLVAVAGAALQRGIATIAPGRFEIASDGSAYASSLTLTADAPSVYLNPAETLTWFVLAALAGALLSATWYRWRARGVLGVLLVLGVVWSAYAAAVTRSSVATSNAVNSAAGTPFVYLGICLVLATAVWLVLRRVPLRPLAR